MARKKIQNWVAVGILFMVLVAMVITGFGTGGSGGLGSLGGGGTPTGNELAKVGSVAITTEEANNRFNRDFQQLRQEAQARNQAEPRMADFINQDGFEGSVQRLIGIEAMRQFAAARGIVVTRGMIDSAISTSDEFREFRVNGRFDSNLFEGALQRAGVALSLVREEYGRGLLQAQLLQPIVAGFTMPQSVSQAYANVPLEQRSGFIGVVPVGAIEQSLHPTEAEINTYYQTWRRYFTVPERRAIKYALIGPDQVTITAPTDAEIQTVYNNTPRYQAGQIRTLESVNFGTSGSAQADANAFVQRVRGGTSFQQAAQAAGRGEAYARRANQTQRDFANLVTPQIAQQAFSAAQGAIIGPVRSQVGWVVVRVETAAGGQPLAAVRPAIIRELERRKRTAAVIALATQLERQLDEEGASFEEAANGAHLQIVATPAITAQGRLSNGQAWPGMTADVRNLVAVGFEIDSDRPQPVVAALPDNMRYALIAVDSTQAAAPPPLAEIHDLVRGQLVRRTALRQARQIADAIAARINGGMAPAQAFAQAGIPLVPPAPITTRRQQSRLPQAPPALQLFFRLRPGTAGVVAAPNEGGWMVAAPAQSLRATTAPAEFVAGTRTELIPYITQEAGWLLLKAMEKAVGVQRNQDAIRAERRRIGGTMTGESQQQ